ncbi:MAG TPA: FIST N-terminal domain-containing protein [Pseudonocardiaceae bacterium]
MTDGLAGDQQEVVQGAYGVVGAGVPLIGGSAGDDLQMTMTFQRYDDQVLTDAVVAAGIASDAPLGIGVRHGWRRVGEPMLVTRSSGNRVYTLDDRPALDVDLKHIGPGITGKPGTEESFPRLALTHPFGVGRPSGEEQVRFIGDADFTDGSLRCIAQIPQGALVWTMEGDADSVLAATDAACRDALAALDGRPPLGMLALDWIARRGVLGGQGIHTEIQRLALIAEQVPVAGFYTYGEIARTRGMRGFHNQTLVVLSIS